MREKEDNIKNFLTPVVVLFCLGAVQISRAADFCYGFTKVEGVRTNGVHIRVVNQSDTSIVFDTVSFYHPLYGDGYFHISKSGTLPWGKYDVHFEYGSYFKNKTITYKATSVNMGDVELVRLEYYSNDTIIIMRNIQMEVVFKRQTGVIRGLTVKGHRGLLSASEPGQIILRDTLIVSEYQQNNGAVIHIDSSITSSLVQVIFEVNFPYHKALVNYTMDTLTLRWDNEVWLKNVSPSNDRALRFDFSVPLLDKVNYAFWTDENAPYKIEDYFNKTIRYRQNCCILPAVILYDTTLDYGLSFVCPFEVKKPAVSFKLKKGPGVDTFRVSYNYLRMGTQNGKHAQTSLYIVPHQGDWRPGLAWMHNRYPEYFDFSPNSNVLEEEGRFFIGGVWTWGEISKLDTCKIFGVKWEEYYHNKAFFGLYAPQDREQWMYISDNDTWTTYNYWYNRLNNPGDSLFSYRKVRAIIDSFSLRGIGSYPYFNASEVWRKWVATGGDTFPFDSCLAKYASGDTITGFKVSWTMNPDTNLYSPYPPGQYAWSVHIDSQTTAVLDSYPQSVGLFLDRDDYQDYDYAHNDGVSMINTTPVYMLGFALEEINEHICREVHNRNKSIITNGPSGIEVCKNMDAIMSEQYIPVVGSAQYLGLTRPMILFVTDTLAKETEIKDKSALYTGYFPSFEHRVKEPMSRIIDRKYQPLFDLYKGKTWVLYPNALQLPRGIKGNIFKTLNNDLLIPMVSLEKSQLLPDPFEYNLGVKISVPNLGEYDHCYILSGDYIGPGWVPYDPGIQEIFTVPWHMVSSLIQLSTEPRYEYSLISSAVLIHGQQDTFKLRVQNLKPGTKQYSILLSTPFGSQKYQFSLGHYQVREIEYRFNIPDTHPIKEDSFWVINTTPEPDDSILFTNWVLDKVSLGLPERLFMKFASGDSFNLTIVNNTPDTMYVRLGYRFSSGHGRMEWEPKSFPLYSYETKYLPVLLELMDTCGVIQIIITSDGDTVGNITRPIKRAMRPTPRDIFFDDFNSGKISSQWDKDPEAAWSVEGSSAKGSGDYSYHFATIGDVNWTDYRLQMNTKIEGSNNPFIQHLKSYLFFRVQNDTQYYRFGIKGDEPSLVLYRRDGLYKWARLGDYKFHPQKDTWYNLGVKVQGSSIRCFLNGEQVISVNDTEYSRGGIGIGTNEDYMTNYYDDIVVRPLVWPGTLFADNFNTGQMDSLWNKRLGNWVVPQDSGFVRASGSAHFATVAEDCDWTNYRYQVKTRIKGSEIVFSLRSYIFFRMQDTLNFYRLGIYSETGFELHKCVDGTRQSLGSYQFRPQKDVWYTLKIEIHSNQIKCYLNDTLRITYTDNANPFVNGGIGIGVLEQEDMLVDYDDVLVEPLQ